MEQLQRSVHADINIHYTASTHEWWRSMPCRKQRCADTIMQLRQLQAGSAAAGLRWGVECLEQLQRSVHTSNNILDSAVGSKRRGSLPCY
jgi:hypothetical protein